MLNAKDMTKKSLFLFLVPFCFTLLLSGCFGPKTPQEVAKAFWLAVVHNNADVAAKYSTLNKPEEFDGFSMKWDGYQPSWGKVIIDGDQASIVTEFTGPDGSETNHRKCTTYLVRQNDVWKVDYKMTGNDLHGGALGVLFGKLSQLGNDLSKQINSSVAELNVEMDRLSRKLEDMADSFSQQAAKIIDQHAQELQNILQELEESINRALKDDNNHLSDQDRQMMIEVSSDLDASGKRLANPSTATITNSGKTMGMAQQRLGSIDGGLSDDYKKRWHELGKQFEENVRKMLDELTASVKQTDNPK